MRTLLRKIRGLLGVGLVWGGLWSVIGAGIGLAVGVLVPGGWEHTNPIFRWALGMGLYGCASGAVFGGLLTLLEGRHTLFGVSLPRAALWGIAGAAMIPPLFGALGMFDVGTTTAEVVVAVLVTAFLGGTFAPASIVVARRAELRDAAATAWLKGGGADDEEIVSVR